MNDRTRKDDTFAAVKGRGALGEDVRVVLVERKRTTYVTSANGRLLRGQRTVAHNVTDVPFVFAALVRRRPVFQEDPSTVFLTVRLFVAPPHKVEVEPCFVVAALIGRADAESLMRNNCNPVCSWSVGRYDLGACLFAKCFICQLPRR